MKRLPRRTAGVIAAVCLLPLAMAFAAGRADYVSLRQRLSPAQLASTGISDAQVDALDTLLRAAWELPANRTARETGSYDPTRSVGLDTAGFSATVKGVVAGWSPGTVFDLDNGQQWTVLKGSMVLPKARQSPRVRLVPGVAGRWFLEIDEDLPKARVYRVD